MDGRHGLVRLCRTSIIKRETAINGVYTGFIEDSELSNINFVGEELAWLQLDKISQSTAHSPIVSFGIACRFSVRIDRCNFEPIVTAGPSVVAAKEKCEICGTEILSKEGNLQSFTEHIRNILGDKSCANPYSGQLINIQMICQGGNDLGLGAAYDQ